MRSDDDGAAQDHEGVDRLAKDQRAQQRGPDQLQEGHGLRHRRGAAEKARIMQ
jgi:hypothetical protein